MRLRSDSCAMSDRISTSSSALAMPPLTSVRSFAAVEEASVAITGADSPTRISESPPPPLFGFDELKSLHKIAKMRPSDTAPKMARRAGEIADGEGKCIQSFRFRVETEEF